MGRKFRELVDRDIAALFSTASRALGTDEIAARLHALPEPVQRHLRYALPAGTAAEIRKVHLRHEGFFRPNPGPRWFPIVGEQYFALEPPGFVWHARMRIAPLLWIEARDRLISGSGNMLVKFNSVFTLADVSGPEMDQSGQARWLAETVWFPPAYVGPRIQWAAIDDQSARATLTMGGVPVSMVAEIDSEGRFVRVSGERYRAAEGGRAVLTPWSGTCSDYREFGRFRIPASVEVTWHLPEGEFSYARFNVTALEYGA